MLLLFLTAFLAAAPAFRSASRTAAQETGGGTTETKEPVTLIGGDDAEVEKSREQKERERLERLLDAVEIHGYRQFKYRDYDSSGNSERFLSQNGLVTRGDRFEQETNLVLAAKLENKLKVTGHFHEFPQQERDIIIDAETPRLKARFGDFVADFRDSEISSFTKKITGTRVNYSTAHLQMGFFASQSKSVSRSETFTGRNHHGPYDLRSTQVVEGSENVYVNGQRIPADQYQIEYFLGTLTFCARNAREIACRVLTPADQVRVTYDQKTAFSLDSGNLMGISASFKPGEKSPWRVGGSTLTQQANAAAEEVKVEKTARFTVGDLYRDDDPDLATLDLLTLDLNDRFLVKDRAPTVFVVEQATAQRTPLALNQDYFFNGDRDAPGGKIRFSARMELDYQPDDVLEAVYFRHSDDFAVFVRDIYLTNGNRTAPGSDSYQFETYQPIYSGGEGFETVFRCVDPDDGTRPDRSSCRQLTEKEYRIDDRNNRITILDLTSPLDERASFIMDYWSFPASGGESSAFDHTVNNAFVSWAPGESLRLRAEIAKSQTNPAENPIQITGELVAAIVSPLDCSQAADGDAPCTFALGQKSLAEGTLRVYFNDTLRDDAVQLETVDYTADLDTGQITFKKRIDPAAFGGTVAVYADYQFRLPASGNGLVSGAALRLTAAGTTERVSYSLSVDNRDVEFAPLGAANTQEVYRLDSSASVKISKSLSADAAYSTVDEQFDVLGAQKERNIQRALALQYGAGKIKSLRLEFGKDTLADNRDLKRTDSERKKSNASVSFDAPGVRGLVVTLASGAEDFSDNTDRSPGIKTSSNQTGLNYAAGDKISVNAQFGRTNSESSGGGQPSYSNKNRSRIISLSLVPHKLVNVTGTVNSQRSVDSRTPGTPRGIDSSNVGLTVRPFGNFRSIQMTVSNQDFPNVNAAGTKNRTTSLNFSYILSPSLDIAPTLTLSRSASGANHTDGDSLSFVLRFQPPKNPSLTGNLRWETSSRTTRHPGGASESDTDRVGLDFRYAPGPKWVHSLNANKSLNSTSTGEGSNSRHLIWKSIYQWSRKLKLDGTWQNVRRWGSLSGSENTYTLTSNYKLSKILSWETMLKLQNNRDSAAGNLSYDGRLLETQLRAEWP